MIVNKTYEIDSCDDVELGIKRESKLEFKLWYDDEKNPEALVFIVQGMGADCNDIHLNFIIESLSKNFNVAFVGVNYHCIGNRPQTGSTFYLDDIDKLILKTSCEALGIKVDLNRLNTLEDLNFTLREIDTNLEEQKEQGIISSNFKLGIHLSLQPTKNEYQNFGVMQAQDLLNAALYLKTHAPFDTMARGGVYPLL